MVMRLVECHTMEAGSNDINQGADSYKWQEAFLVKGLASYNEQFSTRRHYESIEVDRG